jgi:hypothetical protein
MHDMRSVDRAGTAIAFASLIPAVLAMLCVRQALEGGGLVWWFLVGFLAWICLGLLVTGLGFSCYARDGR